MKVVSPSTMRTMDQTVINNYKIPGIVLMENAGREVALAVENLWNRQKCSISKKIVIFCGKGNNGGDGFVAARHLSNMGFDITVFLLANPNKIAGDAAVNFEIIKNMGIQIKIIDDELDLNDTKKEISDASVLVDAIFGTGLKGEIKGGRGLINLVNDSEVPVIAVDVPSGICGETGRKLGIAIKAKQTVTIALPKIGSLLYPAVDYVGKLVIADIGMPKLYKICRK